MSNATLSENLALNAEIVAEIRRVRERRQRRSGLLKHLFLAVCSLIMIYPLLWMFASSLKPENEIFGQLSLIPSTIFPSTGILSPGFTRS